MLSMKYVHKLKFSTSFFKQNVNRKGIFIVGRRLQCVMFGISISLRTTFRIAINIYLTLCVLSFCKLDPYKSK